MSEQFEVGGEWVSEDKALSEDFYDDIPVPLYWRVMIAPARPKEETRGGIIIPMANQQTQEILNCVGKVVALGAYAGLDPRLGGDGIKPGDNFPKVGDTVFYGRHAGAHLTHRGRRVILLNDDEILAIIPNPDTVATSS